MKNNFSYYLTKFFSEYLPSIKGVSINTIKSYKDTFLLLLKYLHKEQKLNINKMEFSNITKNVIEEFLLFLEEKRKNSISTRNQRLAAIHSFFKYIQIRELSYFDLCNSIISIPKKKAPLNSLSYFSIEEIKILINTPNTKTKSGFRDYVILLFMYESACRAQELVDLTVNQISFSESPYVILHGKGNKDRLVPITINLSNILKKYLTSFKIDNKDSYVFENNQKNKFTTKGIEYILKKYISLAKKKRNELFKQKYSNHSMRHTRAMHLLESGVNLIYIRDILGHNSVVTTEIYAKVNPKIKKEQIIKHSQTLEVKERYSNNQKEDLLLFLKQL